MSYQTTFYNQSPAQSAQPAAYAQPNAYAAPAPAAYPAQPAAYAAPQQPAPAADEALGWDSAVQYDGQEFVLLPEGDYPFTVTGFERARHPGSAKLPPCSMAKLTITVHGGASGDTNITHRLFLHTKTQRLLGAFFASIGQCKSGDTFTPRWDAVLGSRGQCHVSVREYVKKDGTPGQSNEITRFLPPPEPTATPAWSQGAF